ncbi:exo-alpha-sialidase [Shewanella sp. AS16]|uniref:exo-alpha-sialidase n=1 Tax=Shewanella sp. AS16 TaxID=2907625 RepID=UPI001F455300|nr:exo-alpha-sialidase [Shewanella sp. AS16]MCE9687122.1 exo-alpha-sialidase [Shewanella sp. AS16]
MVKHPLQFGWLLAGALLLSQSGFAATGHAPSPSQEPPGKCQAIEARCAATITSAFDAHGVLWRTWTLGAGLYLEKSTDLGKTFAPKIRVNTVAEAVSTRGENRPKLGFDGQDGLYLSWATPREQRYSADIRFSYSLDGGKHFSPPVTVNDDKLLAGHSFNEMRVDAGGRVSLVWLDSRDKLLAQGGTMPTGSAIYLAQATPGDGDTGFANRRVVSGTCQCCRLALGVNAKQELALLWRHLYDDNLREFALKTLNAAALQAEDEGIKRVSRDLWRIEGCPHQGGALDIDERNRYHLVWFNAGEAGKGIFYAYSDDQGASISQPQAMGSMVRQASHPHLAVHGGIVDLVWTEFDGQRHRLMHQRSLDAGLHFLAPQRLAESDSGSDRPFVITHADRALVSWQRPGIGHFIGELL